MKKKLNLNLCENIIAFDFFLVTQERQQKPFDARHRLNNKNYISINVLSLAKEIKQFIRLLNFFSKKIGLDKNLLLFLLENKQQDSISSQYFSKYSANSSVDISFLKRYTAESFKTDQKKLLISSLKSKNKNIENILCMDQVFLNFLVDLCKHNKDTSVYHIYNSLDNNKKLYFLLSLIETLFAKK